MKNIETDPPWHQIVLAVVMIESSEPVSLEYFTQIIFSRVKAV